MYGNALGSRDKVPNSNLGWITGCAFFVYLLIFTRQVSR
jgi:hypothetical protein